MNKVSGLGKRTIAAVIDVLVVWMVWYYSIMTWGTTRGDETYLRGWGGFLLLVFVPSYWIVPEWIASTSLGKYVLGLRVSRLQGGRCGLAEALKRNLLRPVDFVGFYLVGFLVAKFNKNRQRLGDQWANTIVVERAPGSATKSNKESSQTAASPHLSNSA